MKNCGFTMKLPDKENNYEKIPFVAAAPTDADCAGGLLGKDPFCGSFFPHIRTKYNPAYHRGYPAGRHHG
jgi:hypothetical protein